MTDNIGLDVSQEVTHICVTDEHDKQHASAVAATDPEALVPVLTKLAPDDLRPLAPSFISRV